MTNKKELKQDQLEKVSGGLPTGNYFKLGKKLGQYETANYIGHEVVVYYEDESGYNIDAFGTLMRSYEKSYGCGTRRTCDIKLHPKSKCYNPITTEGYVMCYVDKSPIYLIDYYL